MADDLPPLVTRFLGDISNLRAAVAEGTVLVKGFRDDAQASLGAGKSLGAQFGKDLGDGLHDAIPAAARPAEVGDQIGKQVADSAAGQLRDARARFVSAGKEIGDGLDEGIRGALPKSLPDVIPPTPSDPARPKEDGKRTGQAFAGGMSPLILGAFAAAATVGPAAILTGTAAAVLGAEAIATKGNARLKDNYRQLGTDAADALTKATEPLIPQMQASINVLDAGVRRVGPELKETFAAVAPDATALTGGIVSLVDKTLPGLNSGLRAIAPYAKEIGDDFGRIGAGVGGLISGLGQGAAGGTAGFTALATGIERLLPDVGAIVGDLSNGLGPALHDVVVVADDAGAGFKFLADNLPPGAIRATADAVGLLYGAFKIGTMTGAVAEGTKFTQFLTGTEKVAKGAATETVALGTAAEAAAAKSAAAGEVIATRAALATKAVGGLGTALEVATGPLGLIVAGAGLLGNYLGDKFAHDVTVSGAALTSTLQQAANGSAAAQDQVEQLAGFLNDLPWGKGAAGIATFDQQLTQLAQTNPAQAAKEYAAVANAWEKQGKSASDVAGMLPGYTQAVKDAASANKQIAGYSTAALTATEVFNGALITNQQQLTQSATSAGNAAIAALSFAGGQGTLNQKLADAIGDYQLAKGAAGAYQTALETLYGKYQSYSDAQANFTTDLAAAKTGLKGGKDAFDLNTAAGAANERILSTLATANADRAEKLLTETKNQQLANQSLQQGAVQLDNTARQAGFTKTQIDALNLALYGTKDIGSIQVPISANTQPAIDAVGRLIRYIDGQAAYVQVGASSLDSGGKQTHVTVGGHQLLDSGGWVHGPPGAPADATVHGREFVLSQNMLAGRAPVDPSVLAMLRSGPGIGAGPTPPPAPPGGYGGGAAQQLVPVVNVYIDGRLVTGGVRSSALQYKTRNSQTALT